MSRNIFEKRIALKPYEYPELLAFKDAIRHSYWLHSEFNYNSDIQDFKTNITQFERNVITKAMLAISQIEVTVKRFWSDLYHIFPKPEIDIVGVTFGESEARHIDAYSNLLELLGLNEIFETISEIPALQNRVNYLESFIERKHESKQQFVLTMVLFSLFVEHISLFSQFYIMMSYNKFKNQFRGISNAIEATSKEEELHGRFGIELFRILHVEHNELFTEEFYKQLSELARKAFDAEMGIIDWIYSKEKDDTSPQTDLSFCSKEVVKNFIANRYNRSFETLGLNESFLVDDKLLKETRWFDIEVLSTKETDFFTKRSVDYSKRDNVITSDDLF